MRVIRLFVMLLLFCSGAAAPAEITISFYSKDFASSFPHAYVRLTGTDDRNGQAVDVNYGFTPYSVSPKILFGPVRGFVETMDPVYVSRSDRHFSLKLTDDQYRQVLAIVDSWRKAPQPSYRLNTRNCITFVAEVAVALGLQAPVIPKLMKKPKSYLNAITQMNAAAIAQWPGGLGTVPPTEQPTRQAAVVPAH
jgi:hypothetical protein